MPRKGNLVNVDLTAFDW